MDFEQQVDDMINEARRICHDINQPLTVIMARTELLLLKTPEDDKNRRAIEQIHDQSGKLAELVDRLRSHLKAFQSSG